MCHLWKRSHVAYQAGGTNCSEYSHSFSGCCRKWTSAKLAGREFTDWVWTEQQSRNTHGHTHAYTDSLATLDEYVGRSWNVAVSEIYTVSQPATLWPHWLCQVFSIASISLFSHRRSCSIKMTLKLMEDLEWGRTHMVGLPYDFIPALWYHTPPGSAADTTCLLNDDDDLCLSCWRTRQKV